ncbi:zinc finger protein 568-like [Esox lucius]|uniref:C2H2-type domain-containing protein n=1 Tax=Esox lucius TaxID=8010 RepID=A0A3P8YAW4_ESOLU|nr:zinc finger protein 568-like [Esox lucius]
MSKLQLLRAFLNERLTAVAVEIFGAVEKTVTEYQEENERLRRMLRITPDIKLPRIDSLQFSLAVSEEEVPRDKRHCEQELNLETIHIKEEQEEPRISLEEEQLQWLDADSLEFRFPLPCVKSEYNQDSPIQSLALPQTQDLESREIDSNAMDLTPFVTTSHLTALDIPCDNPDKTNAFSNSSAVYNDPVGLEGCSLLRPSLPVENRKPHLRCELLTLTADNKVHLTNNRPSECQYCMKRFNSTCKLKAHFQLCHMKEPYTCQFCSKTFQLKGHLSRHMRIHTGGKAFSCGDCGKSFSFKDTLDLHMLSHTGEKPFSCTFCNKRFSQKANLSKHVRTHTGEKLFVCVDCGKNFLHKRDLWRHMLTHTGEKPFSCGECGKTFNRKDNLNLHMLTHTGENVHKEINK